MSKILLASYRNPNQAKEFPEKAMHIDRRLSPDNITPNQLELLENGRTRIAIFNPVATLPVEKNSVCMGMMFPPTEKWWKPGEEAPDGSFGLFRTGENVVEILTDAVASRTVWYIQTDTVFIASTSQRAIICMLGDLEFNPEAVAWMLSSGSLGPGHSWDRRIKQLPPDSKLVFTPSS